MQNIALLLLELDRLYFEVSPEEYEQARQSTKAQIQQALPGFTIASAIELGMVSAGEGTYQHGGVAHVLLPLREGRTE